METDFSSILNIPPPFNMVVLIVAMCCTLGAIKAIAKQVRIFADHEADRRLKREMIDVGLSPDDAERIASAHVTHS